MIGARADRRDFTSDSCNTRPLLPFWDDSDKGTAHETVSIGDLGDAARRPAGGGVRDEF
jgi:hypothetical protein